MNALDAEYGAAWARTPRAILDRYEAARHFGLLGVARVMIETKMYQPCPSGEPALIVACRGNADGDPETDDPFALVTGGPLVDLLAVPFAKPTTWAARIGAASFLGACEPQFVSPPPVRVWRTPIAWLRGGCEGVVLLTTDQREQQHLLLRFRTLAAEDLTHREHLRRIVARPWLLPKILVPRERRAA